LIKIWANFHKIAPIHNIFKIANMAGISVKNCFWVFFLLVGCQANPNQGETTNPGNTEPTVTTDKTDSVNVTDAPVMPKENRKEIAPAQLIIPGKSIGQTAINMKAEEVNKRLGKGDKSNAAMGKAWAIWYSKPTARDTIRKEATIYFVTNMGGPDEASRVKQIRVTSAYFKTADNLGVGSKLEFIQPAFPHLKQVTSYASNQTNQPITILDDIATGIAFEINPDNTCVAAVVHEPQQPVNTTYINLFP